MQGSQQTSPNFAFMHFNQTPHVVAYEPIVFIHDISYDDNSICSVWDVFKESPQGNIMVISTWSEFFLNFCHYQCSSILLKVYWNNFLIQFNTLCVFLKQQDAILPVEPMFLDFTFTMCILFYHSFSRWHKEMHFMVQNCKYSLSHLNPFIIQQLCISSVQNSPEKAGIVCKNVILIYGVYWN